MPLYGYRCSRAHLLEIQQRITDPPLTACPECGAPTTRIFYPVGIIFKGQGFYKTDSRGVSTVSTPASDDGSTAAPTAPAASGSDGQKGSEKPAAPTSSDGGGKQSSDKPAAPKADKKSDS
jgi:putative FmdB family regulatory protein